MSYTYDYPKADHTTDLVVFAIHNMVLKVALTQRGGQPFKDYYALPGGFLNPGDEDLDGCARRELQEETSLDLSNVYIEQLYTFSDPNRDPRGHVITTAYYALVPADLFEKIAPKSDAKTAKWFPVADVIGETGGVPLAFDHGEILHIAVDRIRGKIDYFPKIAMSLLPESFSMSEYRHVHEIVKGTKFDASNFNKRFRRMVADGRIIKTGGRKATGGRLASLYRINDDCAS